MEHFLRPSKAASCPSHMGIWAVVLRGDSHKAGRYTLRLHHLSFASEQLLPLHHVPQSCLRHLTALTQVEQDGLPKEYSLDDHEVRSSPVKAILVDHVTKGLLLRCIDMRCMHILHLLKEDITVQALMLTAWVRNGFFQEALAQHHICIEHVQHADDQASVPGRSTWPNCVCSLLQLTPAGHSMCAQPKSEPAANTLHPCAGLTCRRRK